MQIETVRIAAPKSDDNPLGYIVINKSDLAEGMALFVGDDEKAEAEAAAKAATEAEAAAEATAAAAEQQSNRKGR